MIRKVTEYSLNVPMKAMFTLTVFEMFLFKGRLVLSPTQRGTESTNVLSNSIANFSPRINSTCATSRNLPAVENIQSFLACNNGSRFVSESKMDLQSVSKEFVLEELYGVNRNIDRVRTE